MNAEVKKVEKDYYQLNVNGNDLGTLERSELRHLIEIIDNAINVGLESVDRQSMSAKEFELMVSQARQQAMSDMEEDCLMCGS